MTDDLIAQLERIVEALRRRQAFSPVLLISLLERAIERLKQQPPQPPR